jgi:hypothetical protein
MVAAGGDERGTCLVFVLRRAGDRPRTPPSRSAGPGVGQAPVALRDAGDPEGEVGAAYPANEPLRGTYLAGNVLEAHRRLVACYDYCHASDVPELERLARTIGRWETPILRWHHTGLTNATTEGTNLIVKNIKRLGFGFRNFENYRLRLLLRCGAPWRACCTDVAPRWPGADVVGTLGVGRLSRRGAASAATV